MNLKVSTVLLVAWGALGTSGFAVMEGEPNDDSENISAKKMPILPLFWSHFDGRIVKAWKHVNSDAFSQSAFGAFLKDNKDESAIAAHASENRYDRNVQDWLLSEKINDLPFTVRLLRESLMSFLNIFSQEWGLTREGEIQYAKVFFSKEFYILSFQGEKNWEDLTSSITMRMDLQILPWEIFRASSLTKLDLSQNNITFLPPAVKGWTQLRILHLSHNPLKELPEEAGAWTKLETVNLNHTALTEFPSTASRWTALRQFSAYGTKLQDLPPNLQNLESLVLDPQFSLPNFEIQYDERGCVENLEGLKAYLSI